MENETPRDVAQAMSLLLNAAPIDPVLRAAAVKVERHLLALRESRDYWCDARSDDISRDLARTRAALLLACRDGWSDSEAAMEHYLTTADDWLIEPPTLDSRPYDVPGDCEVCDGWHPDGECPPPPPDSSEDERD